MKRWVFFLILFFLGMACLTMAGYGQEGRGSGRLEGVVIDKDKNVLADVKLSLEYMKVEYKLTEKTDKKGRFMFIALGKGVIKVTAEKEGYVPSVITLEVSGVQKNPVQTIILLKPQESDPNLAANEAAKDQFSQGLTLFQGGKYDEALKLFQEFRKTKPDMYKIGINIANCLVELKRYDEGIAEFTRVLEATNQDKSANSKDIAKLYTSIGDAYMRQDKLKEAETFFKKSIDLDKSDHSLAYNVAEILFAAQKTDEAIRFYQLCTEINPKFAKAYLQMGYAYLNQGKNKEAVDMFKKFLELDPTSPEAPGIKEVIQTLK